jgi:DNA-binding Xre family transcriptional regulator
MEETSLRDQLRELIEDSGHTAYSLGKAVGVAEEVIRRFSNGSRDLTLRTADKLCAALGVKLVAPDGLKHRQPGRTVRLRCQPEPLVKLGRVSKDKPIVCGVAKPVLSKPAHYVVKALIKAGPEGLTGPQLKEKSGHLDYRGILRRLVDGDRHWQQGIRLPGTTRGFRYRILWSKTDTFPEDEPTQSED